MKLLEYRKARFSHYLKRPDRGVGQILASNRLGITLQSSTQKAALLHTVMWPEHLELRKGSLVSPHSHVTTD